SHFELSIVDCAHPSSCRTNSRRAARFGHAPGGSCSVFPDFFSYILGIRQIAPFNSQPTDCTMLDHVRRTD
ncbi:MAG TPA: hypothetical protein PKE17_19235, partial [Saprospiraceae bacterium]|nr:hypothetical protein [Saprospiraceae bacterium]